jgi:pimeloyl-ACP methyl ester carboxylesterase
MIETRYARVAEGSSIAYQVLGEGSRDLVVVPGFVSHLEVAWEHPPYERFMRTLATFARVIIFDKRSSGLSDPLVGQPSLEQRVDDIGAVLDAVDADGATLFGISEGAPMAALFAALHPGRVEALVLYGAFARGVANEEYPWAPDPALWVDAFEGLEEVWGEGVSLISLAPGKLQDDPFRKWFGHFERMAASPRVVKEDDQRGRPWSRDRNSRRATYRGMRAAKRRRGRACSPHRGARHGEG